ncbi:MAG: DEAD/DEAH box helicase family protein [Nitrososphaerales archaeon]
MADITISKKNETYISIEGEQYILQELQDCFTFYADGYKYHPSFRAKHWDGKIRILRLVSRQRGELYLGLAEQVVQFCKSRGYSYSIDKSMMMERFSEEEIDEFLSNINLPFELRDYQISGFKDVIQKRRQLLISPTSSGKSATIYLITKFLESKGLRGLIIVPNLTLIHQLYTNFEEYSINNKWNFKIHKIYSGQDKDPAIVIILEENNKIHTYKGSDGVRVLNSKLPFKQAKDLSKSDVLVGNITIKKIKIESPSILLSTWQSLNQIKDKSYYQQFDYVIVDEAHQAKSKSITDIMEKCINSSFKTGLTGTLDGLKVNEKTLIGLFGPVNKLISTKELMDRKQVANFKIECLVLKYDKPVAKIIKNYKYQEEIKFLITNNNRNIFIKNLALSLKKNTIILFNYVDSHGRILYELLNNSKHKGNRNIYFIHGGVDSEERERIRKIIETEEDAIIVASVGTMSTGTSINNLYNIIFASPAKSRIRNLQSIGRVLRLHDEDKLATLFDIVDNLEYGKHKNFSLQHFFERIKIYDGEQFNYRIKSINFTS